MTQGPKIPSPENKRIAHHAAQIFGGTPRVTRFGHDTEDLSLSILSCVGCPEPGITAYATIGLSDHEIDTGATTGDLRIELGGACRSDVAIFPNILSTAAFCLIRSNRTWRPGSVLRLPSICPLRPFAISTSPRRPSGHPAWRRSNYRRRRSLG